MNAASIQVRGTVQGVGFRPFVFRLARAKQLAGWVLNAGDGVDIHVEGQESSLAEFVHGLQIETPPAARISAIEVRHTNPRGFKEFAIRQSSPTLHPSVPISPDLPVCESCLKELRDARDRRYRYPYINCTDCGPRYTIVEKLPYDRGNTTMQRWAMDGSCTAQFENPADRRFHAQPLACPACGPHYYLQDSNGTTKGDEPSIARAAELLRDGAVVAIKGIGGYHLACDATNPLAVRALRERKFRREKPFALMVRSLEIAQTIIHLDQISEELLGGPIRPIVVAPSKIELEGVAPNNADLGVMLPYTPLHHLLFESGAPDILVMTSANRSNEPLHYRDEDAIRQLSGIADAFLIGERAIARPVDDSIVQVGALGTSILRFARGYAPGRVSAFPESGPVLAVGGDLKSSVTLVMSGQAFMSPHIGDLEHHGAFETFCHCIEDFVSMYEVPWSDLTIVHDRHPGYRSASHAMGLPASRTIAVQHHRAHIASVIAERHAWEERVVGVALDGTGYGDDASIWGGELFVGSIPEGFERVLHLRQSLLPGGDAAARRPVQAAAGFLAQLDDRVGEKLFGDNSVYNAAVQMVRTSMRAFPSSSMGRLFDCVAAILGFTRQTTFEGQAAMWLEHQARAHTSNDGYPFPLANQELDFRPLLDAAIQDRLGGCDIGKIARKIHFGIAHGLSTAIVQLCETHRIGTVVLAGGVFQNQLLLQDMANLLTRDGLVIWTNRIVPTNDGGISLGQAALAVLQPHA